MNLEEFEKNIPAIADTALEKWRAEASPTTRWPYITRGRGDKVRSYCATDICCGADQPTDKERPPLRTASKAGSDIELAELKSSEATGEPGELSAPPPSAYSPRLLGQRQRSSSDQLTRQQFEALAKRVEVLESQRTLQS